MADFKPRFKEGDLVATTFLGIVTEIRLGKDEDDTFYEVFVHHSGHTQQFKSCLVAERRE